MPTDVWEQDELDSPRDHAGDFSVANYTCRRSNCRSASSISISALAPGQVNTEAIGTDLKCGDPRSSIGSCGNPGEEVVMYGRKIVVLRDITVDTARLGSANLSV